MVDEYLNWDDQFKIVKSKICGGRASLKKLKNILPQSKLDSAYYAIVESHLRYTDVSNLGKSSNEKNRNSPKIAE